MSSTPREDKREAYAEEMGLLDSVRSWASRKLSPAGTQTFVQGGGNDTQGYFQRHERDLERLEEYGEIWERGGPVAALVDTRSLMTFGTGADFVTGEDHEPTALVEGEAMTVTEWLDDAFDSLDNLLVRIARDSYIYGDSLGEIVGTRGGNFSKVELVNPATMQPFWDQYGRIHKWTQEVTQPDGETLEQSYPADEIAHFKLKGVGRSPTGVSLIEQNYDEIMRFARNQEAIENAMRLHGFPKYHVKVGREGAGQVPDRDLRRVRSKFNNFNEKTNWVTGRDIEMNVVDTAGFEVEGLAEHDLMILAAGFQVPEEMAGLGRGSTEATAKVRLQAFERNARAEQRTLADQFIEQVVRPVLDQYSPFPRDVDVDLEFGDVVSDQTTTAEWLKAFESYYGVNEVREKLGDSPLDDEELEEAKERREGAGGAGGLQSFPAEAFGGGGEPDATGGADAPAAGGDGQADDRGVSIGGREQGAQDEPRRALAGRDANSERIPGWILRGEVRADGGE